MFFARASAVYAGRGFETISTGVSRAAAADCLGAGLEADAPFSTVVSPNAALVTALR